MTDVLSPWELHPALVHFPIAFLIAAAVMDAASFRRKELARFATSLSVAGVASGFVAVLAGLVAWQTIPAHTDSGHTMMTWHIVLQSFALCLFAVRAFAGWRAAERFPRLPYQALGWIAVLALLGGSALGGRLVYREGIGVVMTSPAIAHGGHHH